MTRETAEWLRGQVAAIGRLTAEVQRTVAIHCPDAAAELKSIEYACNRATAILEREANES